MRNAARHAARLVMICVVLVGFALGLFGRAYGPWSGRLVQAQTEAGTGDRVQSPARDPAAQASDGRGDGVKGSSSKVVLVLIDNITWDDLLRANPEGLDGLVAQSSIGLLNNRTAGRPSRPREYVTAGAGARAQAVEESLIALDADEPFEGGTAAEAYGRRAAGRVTRGNVVELGIAPVAAENQRLLHEVVPGALGSALADAGLRGAAIGNADTAASYAIAGLHREVAAIAMTRAGLVDFGRVGKDLLRQDDAAPFGLRTDDERLLTWAGRALQEASFVAIDFGDTFRADAYAASALPGQAERLRHESIRRAFIFISALRRIIGRDATLMVASLSPPGTLGAPISGEDEQLTPVLVSGPGFRPGYLSSPSTRRRGLVSNADIAPTVLSVLGLDAPYFMLGRPVSSVAGEPRPESLNDFNARARVIKAARPAAIIAFILLQVITILLAAYVLLWRRGADSSARSPLQLVLIAILSYPLVSFGVSHGVSASQSQYTFTAAVILGAFLLAAILFALRGIMSPVVAVSVATILVLGVDTSLGSPLQVSSIFGYDAIVGGRFYGMGNESMALLIAATLVALGLGADRLCRAGPSTAKCLLAGLPVAVLVALVVGFPSLGANAGGTVTAVAAFGFAALFFRGRAVRAGREVSGGRSPSVRQVVLLILAVAGAVALFVGIDVLLGSNTHLGRTFDLVMRGGLEQVGLIIKRKFSENLTILVYSSWSYFLVGMVVLLGILFRRSGIFKSVLDHHPGLAASVAGAVVAGAAGFLVNDSGIAITAVIFSYALSALLYFALCVEPGGMGAA